MASVLYYGLTYEPLLPVTPQRTNEHMSVYKGIRRHFTLCAIFPAKIVSWFQVLHPCGCVGTPYMPQWSITPYGTLQHSKPIVVLHVSVCCHIAMKPVLRLQSRPTLQCTTKGHPLPFPKVVTSGCVPNVGIRRRTDRRYIDRWRWPIYISLGYTPNEKSNTFSLWWNDSKQQIHNMGKVYLRL